MFLKNFSMEQFKTLTAEPRLSVVHFWASWANQVCIIQTDILSLNDLLGGVTIFRMIMYTSPLIVTLFRTKVYILSSQNPWPNGIKDRDVINGQIILWFFSSWLFMIPVSMNPYDILMTPSNFKYVWYNWLFVLNFFFGNILLMCKVCESETEKGNTQIVF